MKAKTYLLPFLLSFFLITSACKYIVLPEGLEDLEASEGSEFRVWHGLVTGVSTSDAGDLHIDITIRNDTGNWSTMQAVSGMPALLKTSDGKETKCETVFIGTGGHRFAPGFQMRGYTAGTRREPVIQTLYVECRGVAAPAGSTLIINYVSYNGELDDYDPQANKVEGKLVLNLDEVVTDLSYPIGTPVDDLVLEAGANITGLSDNVVTLLNVERTATGFRFTWENFNPTKFPLKTHIGTPPVIGNDGIIYGLYETLDIIDIPLTSPNGRSEWQTEVPVPADGSGYYILLYVESKKPRTYLNYVLDIRER